LVRSQQQVQYLTYRPRPVTALAQRQMGLNMIPIAALQAFAFLLPEAAG
jgi:hypothetical protein